MKLATILVTLMLSIPSLAQTPHLNLKAPVLEPQMNLTIRPLQTDLIRLFLRLPTNRRMLAGFTSLKNEADFCNLKL